MFKGWNSYVRGEFPGGGGNEASARMYCACIYIYIYIYISQYVYIYIYMISSPGEGASRAPEGGPAARGTVTCVDYGNYITIETI